MYIAHVYSCNKYTIITHNHKRHVKSTPAVHRSSTLLRLFPLFRVVPAGPDGQGLANLVLGQASISLQSAQRPTPFEKAVDKNGKARAGFPPFHCDWPWTALSG